MKFFKTHLVNFLKLVQFTKTSENTYDLSKFFAPILCSQVHMSAAESLGSHQLNSFVAFLEENLHTSSENSIVQNPQLNKMADGKKPERSLKSTLRLKSLRKFMLTIAHLMKQNLAKKTKISARCEFRRLNGDGQGNGGNTDM